MFFWIEYILILKLINRFIEMRLVGFVKIHLSTF